MRKLRVGVWLREGYKPTVGGGFGYYSEMIEAIAGYQFKAAEIVFLSNNSNFFPSNIGNKKVIGIKWKSKSYSLFYRSFKFIVNRVLKEKKLSEFIKTVDYKEKQVLHNELYNYCDIIYYIVPECKFPSFPYIYTLWDLGHLTSYSFPELVQNQNFESRKKHHDLLTHKALMVFCESESGKLDAIEYLGINPNRIKVFPLFPSGVVNNDIIPKIPIGVSSSDKFIFYPAQYWAHKNHFGLLQAFKIVNKEFKDLKLVLTGSNKGNYNYIKDIISGLELGTSIIELGFVSVEELKWLYKNSCGLIMPSILGPTNMPPLEALSLGCPVAVSDLPGHREALRDSAIYFNALDFQQIANAIIELITNPPEITFKKRTVINNLPLLENYFAELQIIRFMWGKK